MRSAVRLLAVLVLVTSTGCVGAEGGAAPRVPTTSAAASPLAAASGWQGADTDAEAAGVPYIERTTGGARPDEPLPMIVALHGRGGSAKVFERFFSAFTARARVILPHGATPNGRGGYLWWAADGRRVDAATFTAAVQPVVDQVAAFMAELQKRRPTVGRPVVCGFSQGAMLSFGLAVRHPDQVSAVFPFSGNLPEGLRGGTLPATSPKPLVHAFHGVDDTTITVDKARASVEELRRLGMQVELTEYPMGHKFDDPEEYAAAAREMSALVSRPGGPP